MGSRATREELAQQLESARRRIVDLEGATAAGYFGDFARGAQDFLYRFRLTPTRGFEYVSPAVTTLTGYTPQEFYADADLRLRIVHPADRERFEKYLRTLDWLDRVMVLRWVRKDGTTVWTEQYNVPIYCESGDLVAVEGIARDITALKKAEETIRDSEARWRGLVDTLADNVAVLDLDGNILLAGRTPALAPDRASGTGLFDYVHRNGRESLTRAMEDVVRSGRTGAFELEMPSPEGPRSWSIQVGAVRRGGQVIGFVAVGSDVSHTRRLEAELVYSRKMESVGRLVGGVAHDLNNLLTPILGYANMGSKHLPRDSRLRGVLHEISRAADKACRLTTQLVAFSRGRDMARSVISLNELVLDMAPLIRRLIGEDIELVPLPRQDLGMVRADPTQMEQVLMNLAVNARDAMPDGGKLIVETANVTLGPEPDRRTNGDPHHGQVMRAVTDTGVGMTDEAKARAFEPFFTTKPEGEGTGMGLATCHGIVTQSGGNITVESEPGQGTTVRVSLPRVSAEAGAASWRAPGGPTYMRRGTETILLVEDEQLVRRYTARVLREQGYNVLEAGDGHEGLSMAREHAGDDIGLLLTDMVMPLMSGKQLARQLLAEKPGVKVLYTSGYVDEETVRLGVLESDEEFMQKPFTPAALASKVRTALDG